MLKKLLIAIGILAVLGIVGLVFLNNKIDSKLKEKEPEFRQYLTMTTDEQNAYIKKHLDELLSFISESRSTSEEAQKEKAALQEMQNDPSAVQAGIEMGRSLVAALILSNEDILKDLSATVHEKLQAEADQLDSRSDKYNEYLEKYFPKSKK